MWTKNTARLQKKTIDEKYGNTDCAEYNDYRELLARNDIDAVFHALPDHWHGIICVAAANAGKDIYGQKPLARTIREGRAIVEAVERNGVIWQTGSQQRSDGRFRMASELVRNGRLGKIEYVEVGLPSGYAGGDPKPCPVPEGFDYDMWLGPAPALPNADEKLKVGIIGTLGQRGNKKSVKAIAPYLETGNAELQIAVITVLGNIGGKGALKALIAAKPLPENEPLSKTTQIKIAAGMKGKGGMRVFEKYLSDTDKNVRSSALVGMAKAAPEKALPTVIDNLGSDDIYTRQIAVGLLPELETNDLLGALPTLSERDKLAVIDVLADRKEAESALLELAAGENTTLSEAALTALSSVGGEKTQAYLIAEAPANKAAFDALCALQAEGTDTAVIGALNTSGDDKAKAKYIECLAARQSAEALPVLAELAKGEWNRTTAAAISGLADIVSAPDFKIYAELMLASADEKKIAAIEKSITAAAQRQKDPAICAGIMAEAYAAAKGEAKYALIRALGSIGGDSARAILTDAIAGTDAEAKDAAIRGLCNWPTTEAADQLADLAVSAEDEKHKVLALRGYIRLSTQVDDEKTALQMCQKAASMTDRPQELKSIISSAKRFKTPETAEFIGPMMENPELTDDVGWAIIEISWSWQCREACLPYLEKVIELTENKDLKFYAEDRAKDLKK